MIKKHKIHLMYLIDNETKKIAYVDSGGTSKKQPVIKERYKNMPVRFINHKAFINRMIPSLYVPASIWYIGVSAFAYCSHLESISLPDTRIKIDIGCFYKNNRLSHIIVRFDDSDDWLGTILEIYNSLDTENPVLAGLLEFRLDTFSLLRR